MTIVTRILAPLTTIALVAGAVLVPSMSASAADPKTGEISGRVSGGAYADVAAASLGDDAAVILMKWTSAKGWTFVDDAATDGLGDYEFSGLAAGTYGLTFMSSLPVGPWIAEVWNNVPFYDNPGIEPTKIDLPEGSTFEANAHLTREASISGVVTGSENPGVALVGITVRAFNVDTGAFSDLSATQYGDEGFTIRHLSAGTYKLQFVDENGLHSSEWFGDADTVEAAAGFTVAAGDAVVDADAELALGGVISGTVTKTTGGAIATLVRAYDGENNVVASTTTSAAGVYSFAGLATGDYRIGFSSAPSATKIIPEFYNDSETLADADVIEVAEGETVTANAAVLVAKKFTTAPKPVIAGTAKVGKKLTAKAGEWKPTNATLSYAWVSKGITVGTSSSYTIAPADLGSTIALKVTANKAGYAPVTKTSKSTAKVAKGTITAPKQKLTGTAKVGSTLTAVVGGWKPASATLSYKWLRDGKVIAGQSGATYTLAAADKGKKVSVKVTGSAPGYASASVKSALKKIGAGVLAPATAPVVTGTAKVGETLTATSADWAPVGTVVTFQWNADKKPIKGATGLTLVVPGSVAGKKLTLTATGKKSGYTTVTKTSVPTVAVAKAALVPGSAPVMTGAELAAPGTVLTATAAGWQPEATLTFQWLRDGVAIKGATKPAYTVGLSDRGHVVTVSLTATRTGYTTLTATGADSRTVVPVSLSVDDDYSDSIENDYFAVYVYGTSPKKVKVAGGEVFVFTAAPGFFDYADVEAGAVWVKGEKSGSKALSLTVSPDGSTATVKVPTGSTLATMKAKKKAGYDVTMQLAMLNDDSDYLEVIGVKTSVYF